MEARANRTEFRVDGPASQDQRAPLGLFGQLLDGVRLVALFGIEIAQSLASTLALDVAEVEAWFFSILNELESHKASLDEAKELFGQVDVPPMAAQPRLQALNS